jgi:hypothetical protein
MVVLTGPEDGHRESIQPEADNAAFLSPLWEAPSIAAPSSGQAAVAPAVPIASIAALPSPAVTDFAAIADLELDFAGVMGLVFDDDLLAVIGSFVDSLSLALADDRAATTANLADLIAIKEQEALLDLPAIVAPCFEDGARCATPLTVIDTDLLHADWPCRVDEPTTSELAPAPAPLAPAADIDDDEDDDDEEAFFAALPTLFVIPIVLPTAARPVAPATPPAKPRSPVCRRRGNKVAPPLRVPKTIIEEAECDLSDVKEAAASPPSPPGVARSRPSARLSFGKLPTIKTKAAVTDALAKLSLVIKRAIKAHRRR